MSPVIRAKPTLRTIAIIAAALFAVAVPMTQALVPFGLSAAEFSEPGNSTLRAAGYAFSIWGLLYLGMFVFAGFQALPGTPETQALAAFGWPAVIAMTGCGLWILAAAFNMQWASVVIIAGSALALIRAMLRMPPLLGRERWVVSLPLSLLAGWLTIASVVNILTVVTMKDIITPTLAPMAALVGVGAATVVALAVAYTAGSAAYLAPIAWGLVAVCVAEIDRKPEVAIAALGVAIMLVIAGIAINRHRVRSTNNDAWM